MDKSALSTPLAIISAVEEQTLVGRTEAQKREYVILTLFQRGITVSEIWVWNLPLFSLPNCLPYGLLNTVTARGLSALLADGSLGLSLHYTVLGRLS